MYVEKIFAIFTFCHVVKKQTLFLAKTQANFCMAHRKCLNSHSAKNVLKYVPGAIWNQIEFLKKIIKNVTQSFPFHFDSTK